MLIPKLRKHYETTALPGHHKVRVSSVSSQTDWNVYTTSTQHTVTGLDAGATYQVKVRTRYEGNQGSRWTEVVTGQTAAPTSVPEPPPPVIVPPKEPEFARSSHDVLVSNTGQTSEDNAYRSR